MTPEDLNEAIDTVVGAVSNEPVLVDVAGVLYELAYVEATITGQLVLHIGGPVRRQR